MQRQSLGEEVDFPLALKSQNKRTQCTIESSEIGQGYDSERTHRDWVVGGTHPIPVQLLLC